MSAAFMSVVEELHATAARKLIELLGSQTDPVLLSRLIATALRFKIAIPKDRAIQAARHAQANAQAEASAPCEQDDEPPYSPIRLEPLTDEQVADFTRRFGHDYAQRRKHQRLSAIKSQADIEQRRGRHQGRQSGSAPPPDEAAVTQSASTPASPGSG